MQLFYTERFQRSFAEAPAEVQSQAHKALGFLLRDLRHPSLRAKKYDDARGIWQGRVNRSWRFYFVIEGDRYFLIDIMPHPK
jgi:plasmid maintenance system killer protein